MFLLFFFGCLSETQSVQSGVVEDLLGQNLICEANDGSIIINGRDVMYKTNSHTVLYSYADRPYIYLKWNKNCDWVKGTYTEFKIYGFNFPTYDEILQMHVTACKPTKPVKAEGKICPIHAVINNNATWEAMP